MAALQKCKLGAILAPVDAESLNYVFTDCNSLYQLAYSCVGGSYNVPGRLPTALVRILAKVRMYAGRVLSPPSVGNSG
jgi:hypothetical protein